MRALQEQHGGKRRYEALAGLKVLMLLVLFRWQLLLVLPPLPAAPLRRRKRRKEPTALAATVLIVRSRGTFVLDRLLSSDRRPKQKEMLRLAAE